MPTKNKREESKMYKEEELKENGGTTAGDAGVHQKELKQKREDYLDKVKKEKKEPEVKDEEKDKKEDEKEEKPKEKEEVKDKEEKGEKKEEEKEKEKEEPLEEKEKFILDFDEIKLGIYLEMLDYKENNKEGLVGIENELITILEKIEGNLLSDSFYYTNLAKSMGLFGEAEDEDKPLEPPKDDEGAKKEEEKPKEDEVPAPPDVY